MTKRWLAIAAVALPALVLSAAGLAHPAFLNADTAAWWTTLHLLLLPVFPLLALSVWVLLRDDRTAVGWGGRIAATTYVVFYTALDAIAGIAAGTAVQAGAQPTAEVVTAVRAVGNQLGVIGGYAFFVAVILVLGSAWRRGARGWKLYAAAPALLAAGFLFTRSHIVWPRGGLTLVAFAIGFVLVELTLRESSARRSAQQ